MLLNLSRKLVHVFISFSLLFLVACATEEEAEIIPPLEESNHSPKIEGVFNTNLSVNDSYDYTPTASDDDGDDLTFSIQNKPVWAEFETSTGRLFGTAAPEDVGEYTNIQVSVSDGEESDTLDAFSISVSRTNQAPSISGNFPTSINEGDSYDYAPSAVDGDSDVLTFSVQNKPSWANFDTTTGRLFGVVGRNDIGNHQNIQISVSDGIESDTLDSFTITVSLVNQSPTISGSFPTLIDQDETYNYTPSATDPDGDPLSFSIQNRPSWASFDTATGRLSGAVSRENVGSYPSILISVSDGAETDALAPFTIIVNSVNHPPVISGSYPTSANEDDVYGYSPTASDPDADSLIFAIQNKPSWATFNTTTGRLSGTLTRQDAGEHTGIQISVTDGEMSASLSPFSISVNSVNHAPAITGNFADSINQDESYDSTPEAVDSDDDQLVFSIVNKPSWVQFDTSNGRVFGTPTRDDVALYSNIQVSVSDGELSDELNFSIRVNAVNHPPQISSDYPTSVDENVMYNFTPTSTDEDDDQLTFTITNKPDWANFDSSTGRLYGTAGAEDVGESTGIQVTVSDGEASHSTDEFSISVIAVNHAPTVESQSLSTEATSALTITLGDIQDSDGDVINYQISGTNNTTSTAQSNQVAYLNNFEGTEVFTVTASDGELSSEASITIIVTAKDKVVYYISPTGSDNNNGLTASSPWLSFKHAFDSSNGGMSGGDELVLLDGEYSVENGTGILREVDYYGNSLANSASIPSGVNRELMTKVRAAVDGGAVIIGSDAIKPLFIGRSSRKDRFIEVSGIKFEGGGSLYNSEYVIIKNSGFHGSFSIGTNDHSNGNSYNLIEDVWVWAKNRRLLVSNYRAHNNVWRRVVIRSEGCDSAGCESAPKADPSVGITVYDSHDVSIQNVIVIDRLIRNDTPYGDFATAQHTDNAEYHLGRNEWLGNMSINSQDAAMTFEADTVLTTGDPIWTIKNFISVGSPKTGVNIGNVPYNYSAAGSPSSLIENVSVLLSGAGSNISGIRVSSGQTTVNVKNSVAVGGTRTGYNVLGSSVENSVGYNPGNAEGEFDTSNCIGQCVGLGSDPLGDGSLLYPVRVETNSSVSDAISGVEPGATVINREGLDGAIYGDDNYNTISSVPLWPWPNEARIKQEMCVDAGVTRGFCSTGTQLDGTTPVSFTSYIWEFLGNQIPAGIY